MNINFKSKKVLAFISISAGGVVCAMILCLNYFNPISVVGSTLQDRSLLDGAKVLAADYGDFFSIDSEITIQLLLEAKVDQIIKHSILKKCVSTQANCTNPTWIPYSIFVMSDPLAVPYIDENLKPTVLCTSHWEVVEKNKQKNSQDTICVNIKTHVLWYYYSKT